MKQSLRNVQVHEMMPQTIQSMQLLSMPLFALRPYLCGIVHDNPFLEPRFDAFEEPSSLRPKTRAGNLPFLEQFYSRGGESLYDHLLFQVRMCNFSKEEKALALYYISNINEAGYLEASAEDAADSCCCEHAAAQHVLSAIQCFTPVGVGAQSLSECLCLQADPKTPDYRILICLLQEDIEALASRRIEYLSRKYKISRERVYSLLSYVKTLNPKPGSSFSAERFTPYVMPDARIALGGQGLEIWVGGAPGTLLDFDLDYMKDALGIGDAEGTEGVGGIGGDDVAEYIEGTEGSGSTDGTEGAEGTEGVGGIGGADIAEAREFLKQKRLEAVTLINSLNMRTGALEMLVGYLAVEQRGFFMGTAAAPRPLTQKKAASDLGLSPSTISRCAKEKYIDTPRGGFQISYFFSNELEGGASAAQARGEIAAMIALEDKSAPLSDLAISEKLLAKGIQVTRRTVSKYRAQLGLGGKKTRQNAKVF